MTCGGAMKVPLRRCFLRSCPSWMLHISQGENKLNINIILFLIFCSTSQSFVDLAARCQTLRDGVAPMMRVILEPNEAPTRKNRTNPIQPNEASGHRIRALPEQCVTAVFKSHHFIYPSLLTSCHLACWHHRPYRYASSWPCVWWVSRTVSCLCRQISVAF